MKIIFSVMIILLIFSGCATPTPKPVWIDRANGYETEYEPYLEDGTGIIEGQAFRKQRGGGVVKGAGSIITLNPATSIGMEWFQKAATSWSNRNEVPPSSNFMKARRLTQADADGNFKFTDIPEGRYILHTEIIWYVGDEIQGGTLHNIIDVKNDSTLKVIMTY